MIKIFNYITNIITVIICYLIVNEKISNKYAAIPIVMIFIILFLIPNIQK